MAAKLGDPVDPATSIHTHAGDLDRARALAQQRGVSVARVLRDLLRESPDTAAWSVDVDPAQPTRPTKVAAKRIGDCLDHIAGVIQSHHAVLGVPPRIAEDFAFRCDALADHVERRVGVDRLTPTRAVRRIDLQLKDATPSFVEELAEDISAPSTALGHIDSDEEDIEALAMRLAGGGHRR